MGFSLLLGLIALMIIVSILAHCVTKQFDTWLWVLLLGALVSARIGFVIRHWQDFVSQPWQALYFWQSGFDVYWGLAAGGHSLVFYRVGCIVV